MTAMTSSAIVALSPRSEGEIWPFHQAASTPATPASSPAKVNASMRWSGTA